MIKVVAIENLPADMQDKLMRWLDQKNGAVTYINAPFYRTLPLLSASKEESRIFVVFRWLWTEAKALISEEPIMSQTRWCPLSRLIRDIGFSVIAMRPAHEVEKRNSGSAFYFGVAECPVLYYNDLEDIQAHLSDTEKLLPLFALNENTEEGGSEE